MIDSRCNVRNLSAKLIAVKPALASRSSAQGYGSKRAIIGTKKGDDSDAVDQRIDFKKTSC
ncbi:MAG: hypothetical protein IPF44_07000 [Betaproteobacteria bacterium]|nr:hypothetical protein [Betaproteobacteria bacterium]